MGLSHTKYEENERKWSTKKKIEFVEIRWNDL